MVRIARFTAITLTATVLIWTGGGVATPSSAEARDAVATARAPMYLGYTPIGWISSSYSGRWNIYVGCQRVGYLRQSFGRWSIYINYLLAGYMRQSYSTRWSVYVNYLPVGYVRNSYGSRWTAYHSYQPVGYGSGLGGHLAAGTLVVLYEIGYVG
jgi:hypothetical protein